MKLRYKLGLITLTILLALSGISYGYWRVYYYQEEENIITTGCFELEYKDNGSSIHLEKAIPMEEKEGMMLTPYTVTVTNTCGTPAFYSLNLEVNENSTLTDMSAIRVAVDSNNDLLSNFLATTPVIEGYNKSYTLKTGLLEGENSSKTYDIRLWVDYDATQEQASNKTFQSKISIVGHLAMASDYDRKLMDTILTDNTVISNEEKWESEESGLYKTSDSTITGENTIYYYRGEIENNYILMGSTCFQMIHTNLDGSIRMIYSGKEEEGKCTSDTKVLASTIYGDTFSRYEDSYVKETLDTLLTNPESDFYFLNKYQSLLVSSNYCEDEVSDTMTLVCTDSYTDTIGLLSKNEIDLTGTYSYLKNGNYWTMTPSGATYYVWNEDVWTTSEVTNVYGIRPVINISKDTTIKGTGNGTKENPYVIVLEEE